MCYAIDMKSYTSHELHKKQAEVLDVSEIEEVQVTRKGKVYGIRVIGILGKIEKREDNNG
jgi:hypothetical protein